MKNLKKIKLSQLNQNEVELKTREMSVLKGGKPSGACTCTCSGSVRPSGSHSIGSTSNSAS